jgi:hypothetical protein
VHTLFELFLPPPQPPLSPPHPPPLPGRTCSALISFCWREDISNNKKDKHFC